MIWKSVLMFCLFCIYEKYIEAQTVEKNVIFIITLYEHTRSWCFSCSMVTGADRHKLNATARMLSVWLLHGKISHNGNLTIFFSILGFVYFIIRFLRRHSWKRIDRFGTYKLTQNWYLHVRFEREHNFITCMNMAGITLGHRQLIL